LYRITKYIEFKEELTNAVVAGRRPSLPDGFDAEQPVFAKVMHKAWATSPSDRPPFEMIVFSLEMIVSVVPSALMPSSAPRYDTASGGDAITSLMEPLLPPE
jgi:hypothetical protein